MGFTEVRNTIRQHKKLAEQDDDYFRLDRTDAYSYFDECPKFRKEVRGYLNSLRRYKKPIVHVDITGRAEASSLGADISYSFALNKNKHYFADEDHIFYKGDLFDGNDFVNFLNLLRENRHFPALVTFVPVAGLQSNDLLVKDRETTNAVLEKRLGQTIEILKMGGFAFLDQPFQLDSMAEFIQGIKQSEWKYVRYVKKLARKFGCKFKMSPSVHGPKILLQKSREVESYRVI